MGCLFFAEVDKKVDIDPTLPKDESATGKEGSASPFEASSKSPAYSMGSYVSEDVAKTPSDTGSYTTQPYQLGYSDGSYFMSNTYLLRKQNTAYFIIYDATFFFTK